MKNLTVGLDGIAIRFPGCQSTSEEFDSGKLQGKSLMQNLPAGFIAGTGTVDDRLFLFRNQRRLLEDFFGGNPLRTRDDLGIGQQVEGLANVKKKYLLVGVKQGVEFLRCDAVLL